MLRKETSDHMLQDIIQILEVHPLRLCLGIWGEREGEGFDDKGRSKENGSSLSTLYENFIVVHWTKPSNMDELKNIGRGF